jgi:predicted enzyme related to lactoylglutathione lyase
MAHGEYNHIEIPYDDEERAKRFYSGVFGWQFRQMAGSRATTSTPPGPATWVAASASAANRPATPPGTTSRSIRSTTR